jgi:cellulose synthase/poly-beta-1,6-N-acetylglucosamine synthase-like glycosyltransferase
MRLSAIVPATDAPAMLERCVAAILAAEQPPDEIHVVDDPSAGGPSGARNVAAGRATGDVLVFVDADVEVHPDVFARIRHAFETDDGVVAVFGSYDDDPAGASVVSDFRNLLHHHVHQNGSGPASTFWAGLGAIRRDAFLGAGGFDESRFPHPSVEDIELGIRLSSNGARIVLDPSIQGKHLKRWTLAGMVRTDLLRRGAPWVQLLLETRTGSRALNLGWRHRVSVVASILLVAALLTRRPKLAAGGALTMLLLNRSFYLLLVRRRGWRQAAAGPPLHVLHHLVSAAAVPLGTVAYVRELLRSRSSSA